MGDGHRILVCVGLAALCSLGARHADAQGKSQYFDLQLFHPIATTGGLATVEGSDIGAHLRPRVGLQLSYQHDPLVYGRVAAPDLEAVRTRIASELFVSLGFSNRAELAVALPLILEQSGATSGPRGFGVGDLRLIPKVRLLGQGLSGFSLAMLAGLRLPTAAQDTLAGAGFAVDPQLVATYRQGNLSLHGLVGYHYQNDRTLFNLSVGQQLLAGGGVRYRWGDLSALAEVTAATAASAPFEKQQQTPVMARVGLAYTHAGTTITAAGGPGLTSGYGAPTAEVMISVHFAPWSVDSDDDALPDERDACPLEAEDKDGFRDQDGCPDPDNDEDGIADTQDKCPDAAEDRDGFEDADGCPEPDNDGDAIADTADKCPNIAEDKDGFEDGDGCPDPDNDQDGIADAEDQCPLEGESFNGFLDGDGCPEPDRDRDGVPDQTDKCPDQPEDRNGVADEDGCPDDMDDDKILNDADNCPTEPETYNGYQDEDGCPDELKPRVEIRKESIWMSETLYFDKDGWEIAPHFRPLLRKLAEAIQADPKIRVVYVGGHADQAGSEFYNQWLSYQRAQRVTFVLEQYGVPGWKLRPTGWGAERPSDSNATLEGMAHNRRVVFLIEYFPTVEEVPAPETKPKDPKGKAPARGVP